MPRTRTDRPQFLIIERGLRNTRRNRMWMALVDEFTRIHSMAQPHAEESAWRVLIICENTK